MGRKNKKLEEAKNKLNNLGCEIIKTTKKNLGRTVWYIDYSYNGLKYSKDIYNICKCNDESITKSALDWNNPYSVENANILEKENNPYSSRIVFTKGGTNSRGTMCEYICGICGEKFERKIQEYMKSPYKVCEKCRATLHTSKLKNEEEVFKDIEENYGYTILPNQHYEGSHSKIALMDENGYKGELHYIAIRGNIKISPFAKYNPYALENLRHYVKINGLDCNIPNQKYKGWDLPLKIQCSCGKIFTTTTTHFVIDKQYQCTNCSSAKSNNEKLIELWLKNNNIPFITQFTFKDCYYKKSLPFDFYIKDTNILIEIDGEQHFKPVYFCGKTTKEKREKAIKLFKDTQKRDEIKNKYCETHNYNLIRIPYTEMKNGNYKNILSQLFIKE